jgi:hypothetical protein
MKRIVVGCSAIALSIAAACSGTDTSAPASRLALTMASSFSTVPAGTSDLNTSYVGDLGGSFMPEFGQMSRDGRGPGGPGGFGGPGFGLGFMGGGLLGGFWGDDFGRGFAPVDTSCHYAPGTGVITCGPNTRNGLTVNRTIQFQTASGQSQSAFDTTTTNSVKTALTVTGTTTRRDGDQSTINSSSNQTVTGLAKGNTSRTVNSTSSSTENTTGTSQQGAFTAKRTASDAVKDVVIPVPTSANRFPYPTGGSITRSMSSTVQITGQSATSSSRSETITYDGSATAKVVITQDGVTQNCTLPLPHGRLTCS